MPRHVQRGGIKHLLECHARAQHLDRRLRGGKQRAPRRGTRRRGAIVVHGAQCVVRHAAQLLAQVRARPFGCVHRRLQPQGGRRVQLRRIAIRLATLICAAGAPALCLGGLERDQQSLQLQAERPLALAARVEPLHKRLNRHGALVGDPALALAGGGPVGVRVDLLRAALSRCARGLGLDGVALRVESAVIAAEDPVAPPEAVGAQHGAAGGLHALLEHGVTHGFFRLHALALALLRLGIAPLPALRRRQLLQALKTVVHLHRSVALAVVHAWPSLGGAPLGAVHVVDVCTAGDIAADTRLAAHSGPYLPATLLAGVHDAHTPEHRLVLLAYAAQLVLDGVGRLIVAVHHLTQGVALEHHQA
mmetsp:Transcript_20856/g.64653  ORF Transcript_20856/g.64653 Transcript_20856/m.64653 type:complete len:362 (+) Transcript_20856:216-1301(+)